MVERRAKLQETTHTTQAERDRRLPPSHNALSQQSVVLAAATAPKMDQISPYYITGKAGKGRLGKDGGGGVERERKDGKVEEGRDQGREGGRGKEG